MLLLLILAAVLIVLGLAARFVIATYLGVAVLVLWLILVAAGTSPVVLTR